jgi:hypothetical protein
MMITSPPRIPPPHAKSGEESLMRLVSFDARVGAVNYPLGKAEMARFFWKNEKDFYTENLGSVDKGEALEQYVSAPEFGVRRENVIFFDNEFAPKDEYGEAGFGWYAEKVKGVAKVDLGMRRDGTVGFQHPRWKGPEGLKQWLRQLNAKMGPAQTSTLSTSPRSPPATIPWLIPLIQGSRRLLGLPPATMDQMITRDAPIAESSVFGVLYLFAVFLGNVALSSLGLDTPLLQSVLIPFGFYIVFNFIFGFMHTSVYRFDPASGQWKKEIEILRK